MNVRQFIPELQRELVQYSSRPPPGGGGYDQHCWPASCWAALPAGVSRVSFSPVPFAGSVGATAPISISRCPVRILHYFQWSRPAQAGADGAAAISGIVADCRMQLACVQFDRQILRMQPDGWAGMQLLRGTGTGRRRSVPAATRQPMAPMSRSDR